MPDPNDAPTHETNGENPEQDESVGLVGVLDRINDTADDAEEGTVTLGAVVDHIGSKAYGPLLLMPAAVALFPLTGGIPGASIVTGTWIMLVAVQILFRSRGVWLPAFLRDRGLSESVVRKATERLRPWANRIEVLLRSRFTLLTGLIATKLVALVCIGLAVTMYPLSLVPMGVAPPSATICLLALGLTAGDGLVVGLGLVATIATGVGTWLLLA